MCVLTTVKLHCVTALISFFRFVYNHFHPHAKSWWNKKYFHFFFYFSKTLSLIFLCKIERILLKPLFFSYLLWKKIFFFSSPKYPLFTAYNQIIYPFDITFLMKSKKKKKTQVSSTLFFIENSDHLSLLYTLLFEPACHLHCYTNNILVNVSIGLLRVPVFKLSDLFRISNWTIYISSICIGYSHPAFQA